MLGRIAGRAIALAMAYALAAPAVFAADQYAKTELGDLIAAAPQLVVAGERLNLELLRRFYARHGFAPVWPTHQSQASSLTNAVLRGGDHGLTPERFHASPKLLVPVARANRCLRSQVRHAAVVLAAARNNARGPRSRSMVQDRILDLTAPVQPRTRGTAGGGGGGGG